LDLYEFGLQSHFSGKIDSVANNLKGKLALHIQQSSKDTILVTNDLALQGGLILKSNIVFDTLTTSIKGSMEIDQLGLYLPNNVSIEGIRSNVQFSQSFDLQKMCLICKAEPEILAPSKGAIDHAVYKNYYTGARELSNLKIDKLSLVGYTITDFKSQLKISDGWIEIPYIHTRLYDGNMLGHLFIDLAEGDIQNASYILSAHFTNVNSELLLPFSSEKEQASIINGNMDLYGTGIDPTYGVDIGGHFYITKIGPKVVSNLLKAMNPKGTDAGIGITQKLLSWGFKPRVLSFFIGQGYMYPSIQLSHPWYFPARLSGGRIEFSRLPVDFFVQLAMKPTLGAGTHE
jgi:hypothetical protein